MKKLLFIALLLIGITSCNQSNFHKTDLPIEVVSLKDAQKFDTLYTIQTENNVYFFDKTNKEYITTINKESDFSGGVILGIISGASLFFFIMLLLFLIFD